MITERFKVNGEIYNPNPIGYFRNLLGNEVEIISTKKQSPVFPDGNVIVDVTYRKLIIETLKTIYIDMSKLQNFNDQSNSFIFEYEINNEKIPICLVITNIDKVKKYKKLPVTIYPYRNNDTYYNYIAVFNSEPLHAYSTFISSKFNIDQVFAEIKDVNIDKSKYKELYDDDETKKHYLDEVQRFDCLSQINTIVRPRKFSDTFDSKSNIGFLMEYEKLPNHDIFGHIMIISHRKSNLLLYYPNSSKRISADEILFIKKFMEFDISNLPEKE